MSKIECVRLSRAGMGWHTINAGGPGARPSPHRPAANGNGGRLAADRPGPRRPGSLSGRSAVSFCDNAGMDLEDLRLAVYRSFARGGRAPEAVDLAEQLRVDVDEVHTGLQELARARHLVLDQDDRIVMAHPFSAVPLGFAVMGTQTLWWGGCAWDSFALPHLLPEEAEVLVSTRCPACSHPHAWNVGRDQPPDGDQVAHFLVPLSHMWDDVVHTCRHQRLFCSNDCVDSWCDATGSRHGYVMDLGTLWRLASHWYEGRLTRGYVRREPETAREYLRGVGLSGEFWGG